MSAAGSGVSQITGAPAARTTPRMARDRSCRTPCRRAGLGRSRTRPRELLQCTRSIRPVIALTRSTMSARSSPPASRGRCPGRSRPRRRRHAAPRPRPTAGPARRAAGHRVVAARGVLDQHRQRAAGRSAPTPCASCRSRLAGPRRRSRGRRARSGPSRRRRGRLRCWASSLRLGILILLLGVRR